MSLRRALFVISDIKVLQRTLIHRRFQFTHFKGLELYLSTILFFITFLLLHKIFKLRCNQRNFLILVDISFNLII